MLLYLCAALGGMALGLAGGGLGVAAILGRGGVAVRFVILAIFLVAIALAVMSLYAIWLMTALDPGDDGTERPGHWRRIARGGLIASVLLGMINSMSGTLFFLGALGASTTGGPAAPPVPPSWATVIGLVAGTVGFVGNLGLFQYAQQLARRIPDDQLVAHTRRAMYGLLIPAAVMQVGGFFVNTFGGVGTTGPPTMWIAVVGCPTALAALVAVGFWIYTVVLMFRYRRAFVACAADARRRWSVDGSRKAE